MDDTSGEINPYDKSIVNKADRHYKILSWMEQSSILSNMVIYIQYDKHPKDFYNIDIRPVSQNIMRK